MTTRELKDSTSKATTTAYGVTKLGTAADTAAAGNDARLSDTRTPTDGSVTTAKVANGAITAAKVAADVATQAELDAVAAAQAAALADHTGDTTAAHAASAIAFTPTGTIAATDVQAAIAEVAAEASGGGFANPMTATGDMIIGGAAGAPIRLPQGAPNQHLITDPVTGTIRWERERITNPMIAQDDLIIGGGTAITDFALASAGAAITAPGGFDAGQPITTLIDGNEGNGYARVFGSPVTLVVQLSQSCSIVGWRVKQYDDGTYRFKAGEMTVESSDDGTTWTLRADYTTGPGLVDPARDTGTVALAQTITARYWRFSFLLPSIAGDVRLVAVNLYGGEIAGHETRLAKGAVGDVLTVNGSGHLDWVPGGGGGVPSGGTTGQALVKASNTDNDVAWATVGGGGGGGGGGWAVALDAAQTGNYGDGVSVGTSWQDISDSNTFTAAASTRYQLIINGIVTFSSSGNDYQVRALIDGTDEYLIGGGWQAGSSFTNLIAGCNPFLLPALAAGSHTLKIQVRQISGSGTVYANFSGSSVPRRMHIQMIG